MRMASWRFHCLCNLAFTWQVQAVLGRRCVAWGLSLKVREAFLGLSSAFGLWSECPAQEGWELWVLFVEAEQWKLGGSPTPKPSHLSLAAFGLLGFVAAVFGCIGRGGLHWSSLPFLPERATWEAHLSQSLRWSNFLMTDLRKQKETRHGGCFLGCLKCCSKSNVGYFQGCDEKSVSELCNCRHPERP